MQGKTGPQGPPGDKGPTGVKGKEGAKVEPGTQGTAKQKREPGPMPFNNWKECAWKDFFDGKDSGLIKLINTGHTHVFKRRNIRVDLTNQTRLRTSKENRSFPHSLHFLRQKKS